MTQIPVEVIAGVFTGVCGILAWFFRMAFTLLKEILESVNAMKSDLKLLSHRVDTQEKLRDEDRKEMSLFKKDKFDC